MTRYFAAIVLFFLMALMPLAGCVSQNSDISEENDTTVISDNSIVVEPSPVDDVTTNGSATGGGASARLHATPGQTATWRRRRKLGYEYCGFSGG